MAWCCPHVGEKKNYSTLQDVMDKYDLGHIIKSEEFCEILRAKERSSLKVLCCKHFQKRHGRCVRTAAKNEICILKMVKHPNILQLVDVYETKKDYYVFLEFATGMCVFDWILEQGYYSERDSSNVVRQLMEAVAYLHSLHIVHRNLKLESLVYYNRLRHSKIVISDFHLATMESCVMREPCGTPEYLAPEVIARLPYGCPVDCWAVGVIMYILLSGNPPFYAETDINDCQKHDRSLFRKILAGDYEFDSPYWDNISDSAKNLVFRLMEVDQDLRITAQEAIRHDWISGNAAWDKNIKEVVCAQIQKNFAMAKWRKAVRVTTIMKRLRPAERSGINAESSGANRETSGTNTDTHAEPSGTTGDTHTEPRGTNAVPSGTNVDTHADAALDTPGDTAEEFAEDTPGVFVERASQRYLPSETVAPPAEFDALSAHTSTLRLTGE